MKFKNKKFYRNADGQMISILCKVKSSVFGNCFVGEVIERRKLPQFMGFGIDEEYPGFELITDEEYVKQARDYASENKQSMNQRIVSDDCMREVIEIVKDPGSDDIAYFMTCGHHFTFKADSKCKIKAGQKHFCGECAEQQKKIVAQMSGGKKPDLQVVK